MFPSSSNNALRALGVVLALAIVVIGTAQGRFVINGKLKVEGGGLDGCRMVVYKDGEKNRTISADLNRFSLELELNRSYILSFEKNGFVTKKLSFNTTAPPQAGKAGFTPFEFVVSLFKQYDGMNTVVFNQPVGMIRYDEKLADFDYDTDYTKSIQSALDEAQADVLKKQQEEAQAIAEEAKRKEREEKEKAKADARAAKDAQAKAKEAAKQKADQQRQAEVKPAPPPPAPAPPPPAPAAVAKEVPKPRREAPPKAVAAIPKPTEGVDTRPASEPRMGQEPSPVQPALAHTSTEPRPKFEATPLVTVRHKDVIVEPGQVITVVRLEQGDTSTEYRKVVRKYSGVYYFKNGTSCSRFIYENEALAEIR